MARKLLILTEGHSDVLSAKTAVSLLRYCPESVVAVLDSTVKPQTSQELLGQGGDIPVISSFDDASDADTLVIGIAAAGGKIPEVMRRGILEAIERGMNVESGLHQFLSEDEEFVAAAKKTGVTLKDVRKNRENDVSSRQGINEECLRIHTVGHDCSVGKMVTSIEIARGLQGAGRDAKFVATGQTGILVEGDGCPIDCVVSDFVNGSAEKLILANQHHDIMVIEGQGSLAHPRYSAVTLGLLHGTMPHGLIFCYEAGREKVKGMDHLSIAPMKKQMDLYLSAANIMGPCQFIGLAINSRLLDEAAFAAEKQRVIDEFGLPVCDVVREGPGKLIEAVLKFETERKNGVA